MRSSKLQNRILWAFFALYTCVTLYTVLVHEPGRDETAPWLVARDTTFGGLFAEMPYHLHTALWYIIILPFAKVGLPYISNAILNWLAAVAVVYILFWRSPFPKLTSVLAAFSFYLFWQYSIDARGIYIIGILILFIVAHFYSSRFSNPLRYAILLFLLINTNVLMFPATFGLLSIWIVEAYKGNKVSRTFIASIVIVSTGIILATWQVGLIFPPLDLPSVGITDNVGFQTLAVARALCGAFFAGINPVMYLLVPTLVALFLLLLPLYTRLNSFAFFIINTFGILYILGYKSVYTSERHFGILLIGIMFALWISHFENDTYLTPHIRKTLPSFSIRFKWAMYVLNVLCITSMSYGFALHYYDWKYKFSGCTEMANFIKDNKLNSHPIASHRWGHLNVIAALLPGKQFWYAGIGKYSTYIHQDAIHMDSSHLGVGHMMPYERALQKIDEYFPPSEEILILLDAEINNAEGSKYKLIHKVDDNVFGSDERCYLYLRKPR